MAGPKFPIPTCLIKEARSNYKAVHLAFELLPDRAPSERSWTVTREQIEGKNYDLKAVNPNAKVPTGRQQDRTPTGQQMSAASDWRKSSKWQTALTGSLDLHFWPPVHPAPNARAEGATDCQPRIAPPGVILGDRSVSREPGTGSGLLTQSQTQRASNTTRPALCSDALAEHSGILTSDLAPDAATLAGNPKRLRRKKEDSRSRPNTATGQIGP